MAQIIENATTYRLNWSYRLEEEDAPVFSQVTFGSNNSYEAAAVLWLVDIRLALAQAVNPKQLILDVVQMQQISGANVDLVCSIQCQDVLLDWQNTSSMIIQNASRADSTATDSYNRNEISANPLTGRSYSGMGNGSAFKYNNNTLEIADRLLVGSFDSGIMDFDINTANFGAQSSGIYRRTQPPSAFKGVKTSAVVKLDPGNIKRSALYMRAKTPINTLLKRLFVPLKAAATQNCYIGSYRFFSFEKVLRSSTTENRIQVDWETNIILRCKMTLKQSIAIPSVLVLAPKTNGPTTP